MTVICGQDLSDYVGFSLDLETIKEDHVHVECDLRLQNISHGSGCAICTVMF
jgi:hypothetical protein